MNLRKAFALLLAGALPVVPAGCRSYEPFDDGITSVKAGSDVVNITKMGGGIDVDDAPESCA